MPSLREMAAEAKKSKQPSKVAPVKKTSTRKSAAKLFSKSTDKVAESDIESETESEEESEDDDSPVPTVVPPPIKLNGSKKQPSVSSSSSGSEDEESSGSDTSSSGSSESDSESENEKRSSVNPLDGTVSNIRETISRPPSQVQAVRAAIFTPPKGFESLSGTNSAKPKATDFFSSTNLAGKQLWYITAPASIPISSIKKVSMQDVHSGKSAISVDGQDYGFVKDKAGEQSAPKFMLPDESGKQYCFGKRLIDQTLHLQQVVKLSSSGSKSSQATVPQQRPIRQQPKGLKMRFRPIGFGPGSVGTLGTSSSSETGSDSDGESVDARSQFKKPALPTYSDTSSNTDEEMLDAQESIKPKPKSNKAIATVEDTNDTSSSGSSSNTSSSSEDAAEHVAQKAKKPSSISALKRKLDAHEESKTSSSSLKSPNMKESKLKKLKTKAASSATEPKVSKSIDLDTSIVKSQLQPPISPNPSSVTSTQQHEAILPPSRPRAHKSSASGVSKDEIVAPGIENAASTSSGEALKTSDVKGTVSKKGRAKDLGEVGTGSSLASEEADVAIQSTKKPKKSHKVDKRSSKGGATPLNSQAAILPPKKETIVPPPKLRASLSR